MGNKEKKFNRKKLRLLIFIPILALVFYFINPGNTVKGVKTYNPVKTEYLNKIDSKGYLILNERTYTSQGDGVVDYSVRDGERVPKDYMVANLNLMGDISDKKDELLKIQSAIEYKNQSLNPTTSEFQISEKEINLINSIQDALVEDDLSDALIAIETLELNTKKNVDISEISHLINLSNQELEDKRDELSKEISTNNIVYKSEIAGIVSYKVDGLENIYSKENIPKMDYEFIRENPPKKPIGQQNQVSQGDPLYKIIDNFTYYMAIPIDNIEEFSGYKVKDRVSLLINSRTELKGILEMVNKTNGNGVIIVKLDEKLSELGYDRTVDTSIIKDRVSCYVINTKSVVEVNNVLGVYIRELNGIVRFRPIKIIGQNDLDTIVDIGDSKGLIELEDGKKVRTVSSFDEVIEEPANIEEGQIL